MGDDDDRASVGSALRKTRSVDASCLDVRSIAELGSPAQGLSRAKSDFNLQTLPSNDQGIFFFYLHVPDLGIVVCAPELILLL